MDTVALAAAAGATSTIGLLTTVLLGPVWPSVILAKEAASIDAVSGGRFTLGLGLGGRPDDFVVEGLGPRGTGKRLDADIEMFRRVWAARTSRAATGQRCPRFSPGPDAVRRHGAGVVQPRGPGR